MTVMVYSYTQIMCEQCRTITEITPGRKETQDIFKLKCDCELQEQKKTTRKRSSNGKQTKKDT